MQSGCLNIKKKERLNSIIQEKLPYRHNYPFSHFKMFISSL